MQTPKPKLRIAVVGAGLIGARHAELVDGSPEAMLCGVVDPEEIGATVAARHAAPWYRGMADLFADTTPDGLIIATPNQLHADHAMTAIAHRIPCLIEKPITDRAESAEAVIAAAHSAGVSILVGHHRRYNPIIEDAKIRIARGDLGRVVAVHAFFWLYKPDDYFDVAWRRQDGAGPILINLIHDVDLLRHLIGEIVEVNAFQSTTARGNDVEDTACALLRFDNGALGTVSISDSISAPWSWEMTSGENPHYPETREACYLVGGTAGSLSIPTGELWQHKGRPSWYTPITAQTRKVKTHDPLFAQLAHFCAVIRGETAPRVSGEEGLRSLRAVTAIKHAALRAADQV